MDERTDFFVNFTVKGIEDIKASINELDKYQQLINSPKGQEMLTKAKIDFSQVDNALNNYRSKLKEFESIPLNDSSLKNINNYLNQMTISLKPLIDEINLVNSKFYAMAQNFKNIGYNQADALSNLARMFGNQGKEIGNVIKRVYGEYETLPGIQQKVNNNNKTIVNQLKEEIEIIRTINNKQNQNVMQTIGKNLGLQDALNYPETELNKQFASLYSSYRKIANSRNPMENLNEISDVKILEEKLLLEKQISQAFDEVAVKLSLQVKENEEFEKLQTKINKNIAEEISQETKIDNKLQEKIDLQTKVNSGINQELTYKTKINKLMADDSIHLSEQERIANRIDKEKLVPLLPQLKQAKKQFGIDSPEYLQLKNEFDQYRQLRQNVLSGGVELEGVTKQFSGKSLIGKPMDLSGQTMAEKTLLEIEQNRTKILIENNKIIDVKGKLIDINAIQKENLKNEEKILQKEKEIKNAEQERIALLLQEEEIKDKIIQKATNNSMQLMGLSGVGGIIGGLGTDWQNKSYQSKQEFLKSDIWQGSKVIISGQPSTVKQGEIDFSAMKQSRDRSFVTSGSGRMPEKQKELDEWMAKADKVEKKISEVSSKTNGFKDIVEKTGPSLQSLTTDINLAGNALNLFGQYMFSIGKAAVEEAAEWEVLRAKLATFTGSAEEAHSRFKELVTLGLTTPFEIKGLLQAEILLRSFGNETKELLPKVVDLASAMGKDVDKAAYAVARAMSGASLGFLMLQKTWGISYLKLKEFGAEFRSTGQIVANSIKTQNALKLALDELSGSAERLSRTYKGQLSNLSDSLNVLKEQAGQQLLPIATQLVKTLQWILQALNNIPDSIKSVVIGGSLLVGMSSMVVGGFANMLWQVGNLIQGIGALGNVFPKFIEYMNDTSIAAPKIVTGIAATAKWIGTLGALIPVAEGMAMAIGGVVLGIGALVGALALASYWHKVYEERQKQLRDDEEALAKLHLKQSLEELTISLGKVTSTQEAYNKVINKTKYEMAEVTNASNVFNKILTLQNQELEKQNQKVNESKLKWEAATKAKEDYESGKTGLSFSLIKESAEKMKKDSLGNKLLSSVQEKITGKPFDMYSSDSERKDEVLKLRNEQIKENEKLIQNQINLKIASLQKENQIIIAAQKEQALSGNVYSSEEIVKYEAKLKYNNKLIELYKSQDYFQKNMMEYNRQDIELSKRKYEIEQNQSKTLQEQINLMKLQQYETQRYIELYGTFSEKIKENDEWAGIKAKISPEFFEGLMSDVDAIITQKESSITDKAKKAVEESDTRAKQVAKKTGIIPGQPQSLFNIASQKDLKDLQNSNNLDIITPLQTNTNIQPDVFIESADVTATKQIQDQIKAGRSNLDIIKELQLDKEKTPKQLIEQMAKITAEKIDPKTTEERKKILATQIGILEQRVSESQRNIFSKLEGEDTEAMGKGELTRAEHLAKLKRAIEDENNALILNGHIRNQDLLNKKNKEYYDGLKQLQKDQVKASIDMEKDIAISTPSKLDDIEAQKKASIIALNQEYKERRVIVSDTLQLYAWYAAQRKTIDQKAHEDTMKEINAEYEERVNLYTRAQVAQTKLGSLSERRAKSEQDYLNEQAKAYTDYTATKERLVKEQKFEELSKLEIAYLGESKKRNEQHLENIKKIILDELQVRTDLANTMAEHNRKMGEFTDEHSLRVQRESAIAMVNYLKSEATQYEKMAENGDELTDIQRNTLSVYISQEEKLKEINTTLEYRLNAEGQIYDTAYKTFNDKLSLAVSEKKVSEDIATASRAVFIGKQVEFEKTKMALLEQKELTGKITDAERTVLDAMRQRRSEYANISSSIGGFNEKIRSAVSQAAVLKYELTHGADATGIMSDKFKQAYEHAKALLEQVRTIGNITAGANQFGNMGEFSSLEDMIKTQGKFGVDKDGAAKWKAELALKQGIGNDVPDPYKVGREELEKQREELKKRLESGRETESVMKGLEAQIKDLDKQLVEGLATQNMSVTATNVSVNGENVEGNKDDGSKEKKGGGGGGDPTKKTPTNNTDQNNGIAREGARGRFEINQSSFNRGSAPVEIKSALNENTKENPNYESIWSDPKYSYEGRGRGATIEDRTSLEFKTDIKRHKTWDKSSGKWIEWEEEGVSKPDEYYDKSAPIGTDFNTTTPNPFSYDIPANDALASKSGRWAVGQINRSVVDYTHNFLKGMVSQNRDNLKAIAGGVTNNNQNNSSNRNEVHNHYNLNLDGKTINNNNNPLQKSVRETVSLSLAAKTLR